MEFAKRHVKIVVLFTCLAASMSPILVRLAVGMPPMAVGFYRLTFALPFFLFMSLAYHREGFKILTRRQLVGSALAGAFLFLHFLTFFSGVEMTTVASAVVLVCLHPVAILIIMALVFKEKTSVKVIMGVALALFGGAVVSGGDYAIAGEALLGDILCLFSAVLFALYFIAGQKLGGGMDTTVYVTIVFGCCWVFFGLGMLVSGTEFLGYERQSYFFALLLAIVCQIIAHGLFNWTLRYISPLYLATSETIEVVYSSIIAFLLFREVPTLMHYVGGSLTITGILIYNYFEAKAEAAKALSKH